MTDWSWLEGWQSFLFSFSFSSGVDSNIELKSMPLGRLQHVIGGELL